MKKPDESKALLSEAMRHIEEQNRVIADMAKKALDHAMAVKNPTVALEQIRLDRERLAGRVDLRARREATIPAHIRPPDKEADPDMRREIAEELGMLGDTGQPIG